MIDKIDRELGAWAASVVGGVEVSHDLPAEGASGRGVSLYLFEILNTPAPRTQQRPPLKITLRYLVTTWAESTVEAHSILGELIFAALERNDLEVDLEPASGPLWIGAGKLARPSFRVRIPLTRSRPENLAPQVKAPMILRSSPLRPFHGQVIGPGNLPIMGARIELPELNLFTYTSPEGRFHFAGVPSNPAISKLRVRAKKRHISVTGPWTADEPVLVQLTERDL